MKINPFEAVNRKDKFCEVLDSLNDGNGQLAAKKFCIDWPDCVLQCR